MQHSHLKRRLMLLVEWDNESARDLQIPDFWDVLILVLLWIQPDVWLPVMHDSTSAQVMLRRFREEVVARGLAPMGEIATPGQLGRGMCRLFLRRSPAVISQPSLLRRRRGGLCCGPFRVKDCSTPCPLDPRAPVGVSS